MTTHLTAEQMQNYLVRRVSVEELGKFSEHLHGCRTCYGAYLTVLQRRFPIEIDFDELGGLKGWHLEGLELVDYVEGRMSELDFDYASLHLQECVACEQRVNDALRNWLEDVPSTTSTNERHAAPWRKYLPGIHSTSSPRSRLATAFVLVIGFALVLWGVVELKRHERQVAKAPVEAPSPEPPHYKETTPPKNSDPGVVSDPGRRAKRLAEGQPASSLHSGNASAAERQNEIERALIARNLVMPAAIEIFDKSPAVAVRGSSTHIESFAVIRPFSTLVSDEQPTFTWTALSGATSYAVSVYNSNLRLVRTSGSLTEAQWTIPERLRRGALYTWTVAAVRDGKAITAPALPTRAEFTVIAELELLRLNRRIKGTLSHAARGVIYAEEGLLDEAEREFRTHLTLSPSDDRAKKLLETVESWRRLRPYRAASPTTTNPPQ